MPDLGSLVEFLRARYVERVYPLAEWIPDQQRNGGRIFKRRVIVVEDWTEVRRG